VPPQHAPVREDLREVIERHNAMHAWDRQRILGIDGVDRSMRVGLRTNAACSMPGTVMSSMKRPFPVSRGLSFEPRNARAHQGMASISHGLCRFLHQMLGRA